MLRKLTLMAVLLLFAAGLQAQKKDVKPVEKTTLHAGNTLCALDIDGDGDMDYFDGNISFGEIQLVINGKKDYNWYIDSMVSQDTTWQSTGHISETPVWPSAFYVDIDQDGKKDIVVTPHAMNSSENIKCITWYKNTGTTASPTLVYQGDSIITNKTIDFGTGATPMFFDYDKDGRPDLFIGSDGAFQTGTGTLKSSVAYFKNTSTPGNPSFTLQTSDFLNISSNNLQGTRIAFGDLDNNGGMDMVVGKQDGTLALYTNQITNNTSQPQWVLSQINLKNDSSVAINVTTNAAPFIYDVDNDGRQDLLIGCKRGIIYYYRNTGTLAGAVQLHFMTQTFGNVKVDTDPFSGSATPFIGKLDNTNTPYLLVGSASGVLYRYGSLQNYNGTLPRLDSAYAGIVAGQMTAPTAADVDNDGRMEIVIGNLLGGVTLYKQNGTAYARDTSIHVYANGTLKTNAWAGGFNNPQVNIADLNHDGKNDLVIYEQLTSEVKTFLNISGVAGNPDYRYYPDYANQFPPVYSYMILTDYTGDSIPDLFHIGEMNTGYDVYRGYYDNENRLSFNHYKSLWYPDPFNPGYSINAYVLPSDIPAIVDMDGDGDLDFISYNVVGTTISYYKNLQVENHLPKDSIQVCFVSNCWGKTTQYYERKIGLNISDCYDVGTTCPIYPTDVPQQTSINASCEVYPNPANSILHIKWNNKFSDNNDISIKLYNVTGQLVYQITAPGTKSNVDIPLQSIASGMYISEIQSGANKTIKRISVVK
ncbi:T9SS type A sorting domain-containing protein [Taibaiella soli]|uniref:Secretion system C-terminal sorting domain-containing protein n=1 Tax=Taibaiella soli TaxID=1649169 RepID=A0A2W2B057_9BACT|nr:T9SS type A sorting domain-containing protein [Taibaiella soli]PZF73634.1 hypothetical protein DN068_07890 [Taibaiella soli]